MLVIKGTTKKGQAMIENAKKYEGFSLGEVYGSYSQAKKNAWDYCYNKCISENGVGFHIVSHNTFQFTVAWLVENGVRIETNSNSYLITF